MHAHATAVDVHRLLVGGGGALGVHRFHQKSGFLGGVGLVIARSFQDGSRFNETSNPEGEPRCCLTVSPRTERARPAPSGFVAKAGSFATESNLAEAREASAPMFPLCF
jgi:hypothetical protein